jgi:tetratricopeptide (TPR) repeat protein
MRCANLVSRTGLGTASLLTGLALLLDTTICLAQSASPGPAPSQETGPPPSAQQYDQCLTLARADPQRAYDQAVAWRDFGGSFPADHCAAVALIALKRYPEAANKLERIAGAMMQGDPVLRGGALEQAGNAWLLASQPSEAKADFDAALAFRPNDPEILIDRAEANALGGKFFEAVDDLNRALEIAPNRVDALIYRASAYRQLGSLDLALDDAEHALAIEPNAITGLLERGNIRRLKGDLAGAKADWQRLSQLAPNSAEALAAGNNLTHLDDESHASSSPTPTAPNSAAKP